MNSTTLLHPSVEQWLFTVLKNLLKRKREGLLTSLIYVYSPSSQTGSQRSSGSAKHKYIKNNEERDWISSTETHLSWRVVRGYFFSFFFFGIKKSISTSIGKKRLACLLAHSRSISAKWNPLTVY